MFLLDSLCLLVGGLCLLVSSLYYWWKAHIFQGDRLCLLVGTEVLAGRVEICGHGDVDMVMWTLTCAICPAVHRWGAAS